MKNLKINIIISFVSLILLYSCSQTSQPIDINEDLNNDELNIDIELIINNPIINDSEISEIDDSEAVTIVLKIVPGQIVKKEKEKYRGRWVWKVKVKTKGSASVEVKIDMKTGRVLKIEGEDGPYDYDIKTLEQYLKLQEALELALKDIDGTIIKWELKYDNELSWKFEIEIQSEDGVFKVEIKAKDGIVIEIKKI